MDSVSPTTKVCKAKIVDPIIFFLNKLALVPAINMLLLLIESKQYGSSLSQGILDGIS